MSGFFRLGIYDLVKGLVVAIITSFLTLLLPCLQSGQLPIWEDVRGSIIAAVAAGIAYLLKNLFTNSNGELAKLELKP